MRLRVAIPAGVLDTGSASLATFVVQAYAVRRFDPETLGVYAIFFSAYVLASQATQFLLLYPLEVAVLRLPRSERIGVIRRSIPLAASAPVAAVVGALAANLVVGKAAGNVVVGLAVTMAMAASTAPLYEHLKRMLHLSDRSWHAAALSQTQFGALVGFLIVLVVLDVPAQWLPFGALTGSQVVALVVGFASIRSREDQPISTPLAELLRSGRWLFISGLMPPLGTFIAAGLVTKLAGAPELGFAQAAHVAGRPILILASGLSAVLGFRLMEAGSTRTPSDGTRYWRLYAALLLSGGGVYALVAGFDWFANPMATLLPRAYEVGGLVAVTLVANLVSGLIRPVRNELIGAHWEPRVATVDTAAAAAVVAVAVLSGTFQAFAVPLGILIGAVVHFAGYLPSRRSMYKSPRSMVGDAEGSGL